MTASTPKPDLRLHTEFADSTANRINWGSMYAHVHIRPVVLARGQYGAREWGAWDPDSYEYAGRTEALRALSGLEISAQIDNSSEAQDWYGYHVRYAGTDVDLAKAEQILPVLRRINKRMTAQRDTYGWPRDFPAFAAHFAAALVPRVRSPFIRRVPDDHDIEGTGYRSTNAEGLRYWLDDEVKAWREKYGVRAGRAL